MISAIIIDDEKYARETLQALLDRYFNDKVKVIGSVESVKEGVFVIYRQQPDLVFLDVEMPGENGFKLFDYFQRIQFAVIFTTAFKSYAIDAIKVSALDYILKPVNYIDLKEALSRFEKRNEGMAKNQVEHLLRNLEPALESKGKVALPIFSGYQLEKVNAILYCEADQNYTKVFTIRGDVILVSKALSFMEELLPPDTFFRIHKSFLVNLDFVKSYSRTDGYHVVLSNGERLDVAVRRNEEFLKALTHR